MNKVNLRGSKPSLPAKPSAPKRVQKMNVAEKNGNLILMAKLTVTLVRMRVRDFSH